MVVGIILGVIAGAATQSPVVGIAVAIGYTVIAFGFTPRRSY